MAEIPKQIGTSVQPTTRKKVKKGRGKPSAKDVMRAGVGAGLPSNKNKNAGKGGGGSDKPGGVGYSLDAPGTPEEVKKQINMLTRLKYGRETADLEAQKKRTPGYFEAYRQQLEGIRQSQVGSTPGELGGTYGAGLNAVGQLGNQLAQGSASMLSQIRPGVTQRTLNDAANASIARQGLVGNFGGLIASQGLAESGYLANRQASSGPLQIEAQQDANRQVSSLKSEKGAYRAEVLQKLREAAAQAKVDAAAMRLAGIKEQNDVQESVRETRASKQAARRERKQERREAARERRDEAGEVNAYGYTKKDWAAMSPAQRQAEMKKVKNQDDDGGGKGGLTPAQKQAKRKESSKGLNRVTEAGTAYENYANMVDKGKSPTPTQIAGQMDKDGYNAMEIAIAKRVSAGVPLTPQQLRYLRREGITKIPKKWKRGNNKSIGDKVQDVI